MRRAVILVLLAAVLVGCGQPAAARGRVYTSLPTPIAPLWTPAERERPSAERHLRRTAEASVSLLHLVGQEPPQHRAHDRLLVVIAGAVHLHIGDVVHALRAGDVAEIPRGTVHWAENRDPDASELYVVCFPPDVRRGAPTTLPAPPPTP
jgi:quercetin dioxygenase-like cupin family protein